ncbi:MAG: AbrB/MazE/SpoVT family DNA-binding domain-containing protein [Flavobacteriaceae bacterium]
MPTLKVRKIGNSLGATIPQEVAVLMNVSEGDTLHVTRTPDGILLSPYDPAFESHMKAARAIMKRRRNALRELAR